MNQICILSEVSYDHNPNFDRRQLPESLIFHELGEIHKKPFHIIIPVIGNFFSCKVCQTPSQGLSIISLATLHLKDIGIALLYKVCENSVTVIVSPKLVLSKLRPIPSHWRSSYGWCIDAYIPNTGSLPIFRR